MIKYFTTTLLLTFLGFNSFSQFSVKSTSGVYDSILTGIPYYYQYSWDDPLDEIRDTFKLTNPFRAFNITWDSALISDGSLMMISSSRKNASLIVDATGWDLIDKGWEDTINYPNLSPVMLDEASNTVEWRNFGFVPELDTLGALPSTGNVKIRINNNKTVDFIYGDFAMVRPDLCFEGFGGLRPSVTFLLDSNLYSWILFGDPTAPVFDSTYADTAFNKLPPMGQVISVDFGKTSAVNDILRQGLHLYPNPAKDMVHIAGKNLEGFEIIMYSTGGSVVYKGKIENSSFSCDSLPEGIYYVKIFKGNEGYYSRLWKSGN